ncbi:Xylose isomerase domain protein TIM barrel [Rhodovulum sp. P5]|uniref:sugar phosphate isomerase/epimerase family protein n=1 Tax=Rhodovulum sp. P5 TaxID=1564506 RepID=UPI0009C1F3A3|nr:sugar phosphate isomerase/epimerase family protein [Rhodovulum sp. P5]ARE39028.1 Xylose isomerase domain protein TIM barrel [Rhodovulum sp. P5]
MTLPVIGACLGVPDLPPYLNWLKEKDRDLELQTFHKPEVLSGDWQPLAEEAVRLLDGHAGRRGIHGPFWGFVVSSPDPEIRAVVARRMDQGLDICAAVGATQMVVHSPIRAWDNQNFGDKPDAFDDMVERTHQTLGAAVARAADQGVVLVVENIEDIDPEHRKTLVESFGSDAIALSIDTGHAHYSHVTNGAPPVDYYVTSAGDRLHHVHLQDADGHADRHWAPGEGTILWTSVFRALGTLSSNPRLVLELRDKARIPAAMAYLAAEGLGQ